MAQVIRWPQHVRHNCDGQHEDGGYSCMYCGGGLYLCAVCGGAEGDLPTDCPGYRMHEDERAAVYNRHIDYVARRGGWVALSDEGNFSF